MVTFYLKGRSLSMDFTTGDIFYTTLDQEFHLFKLLKRDIEYGIYHVLGYAPVDELPAEGVIPYLDIAIYHSPFDINAFPNAILTEIAVDANKYFQEAIDNRAFVRMDMGRWEDAIRLCRCS